MDETAPPIETDTDVDDQILLAAAGVRKMFGNVSDMTLWRWVHDPSMGFPSPVYIAKRRYWRRSELRRFIAKRTATAA